MDSLLGLYGERILAVDLSAARRWGRLSGLLGHESADLLIAATALEHGLTVVTRNVRHFEPAGVPVLESVGYRGNKPAPHLLYGGQAAAHSGTRPDRLDWDRERRWWISHPEDYDRRPLAAIRKGPRRHSPWRSWLQQHAPAQQ